jgi:hypothetical protein
MPAPVATLHFNKNFWTKEDECECKYIPNNPYGTEVYSLSFRIENRYLSIRYNVCLFCNHDACYEVFDEEDVHEDMDEDDIVEYVQKHYPMIEVDIREEGGRWLFDREPRG